MDERDFIKNYTDIAADASSRAEALLKYVTIKLRENTAFAFLEAKPNASEANTIAEKGLVASRGLLSALPRTLKFSQALPPVPQPAPNMLPDVKIPKMHGCLLALLIYFGISFGLTGFIIFGCILAGKMKGGSGAAACVAVPMSIIGVLFILYPIYRYLYKRQAGIEMAAQSKINQYYGQIVAKLREELP